MKMKRKFFALFLGLALSAAIFTGCGYDGESWVGKMYAYVSGAVYNSSGMKNIDKEHKDAFDSVFENIEIFGARLCVPMKVSELPNKFELGSFSNGEFVPLSEKNLSGKDMGGGLTRCRFELFYDREINIANVVVICRGDQSVEEGIICEIEFSLLDFQPVLLGGSIDAHPAVDAIKEFLGEGNLYIDPFTTEDSYINELFYTDGNRIIEFTYGTDGNDTNVLISKIRTYNNYDK